MIYYLPQVVVEGVLENWKAQMVKMLQGPLSPRRGQGDRRAHHTSLVAEGVSFLTGIRRPPRRDGTRRVEWALKWVREKVGKDLRTTTRPE